jgi:hypothetical protein
MDADLGADEFARMADQMDDRTYLYARKNGAGIWVRDAKFITDCFDLELANAVFAGHVDGAQVLLCAVLRGQVATVDDFELAEPGNGYYNPRAPRRRYTVFGCWDTGDGHRRYSKQVEATSPVHAEVIVNRDKTVGEFLVAGVVEGWVPVEDRDAVWATVDGQPAESSPVAAERRTVPRWLLPAAVAVALLVVLLIALILFT